LLGWSAAAGAEAAEAEAYVDLVGLMNSRSRIWHVAGGLCSLLLRYLVNISEVACELGMKVLLSLRAARLATLRAGHDLDL
jgi:hypothetical protein